MVFGADWDESLTPKEMKGRAYTTDELRIRRTIGVIGQALTGVPSPYEPRVHMSKTNRRCVPACGVRGDVRWTLIATDVTCRRCIVAIAVLIRGPRQVKA